MPDRRSSPSASALARGEPSPLWRPLAAVALLGAPTDVRRGRSEPVDSLRALEAIPVGAGR